ncbi:MAG: FecR domain-containing protein [Oscillospiraceae bacterium]|nr:FecR domain-containing protein [Oscillospiraceae bacterium]
MRRILSLMLTVLMLFMLAVPAGAASENIGTTIRLSELEGKVKVLNASGKEVNARAEMRLYNGYTLETGASSTAYISLDDTKALKLDANGKVELRKSGKQIEVSLLSGNLFFGVEQPLKSNESLEIRTSSMVTGVRGSYGWVNLFSSCMMHGHANVTCTDTVSGESINTTLGDGEYVEYTPDARGSVASTEENQRLQDSGFTKSVLQNEDVIGLAATAVAQNDKLREQINVDGSTLNGDVIAQGAENKVKQEELERQNLQQQVNQQSDAQAKTIEANNAADQSAGIKDQVPFVSGSNTSTGSTAVGTVDRETRPSVTEPDETTIVQGDTQQLTEQLKNGKATIQTGRNPIVYTDVRVESGQTLLINGGGSVTISNLNIGKGADVQLDSGTTLTVVGQDISQAGTVTNNGIFNNSAEIALIGNGKIVNNGTYVNDGVLAISANSSFTGGTIINEGTIIVNGELDEYGVIISGGGVVIRN